MLPLPSASSSPGSSSACQLVNISVCPQPNVKACHRPMLSIPSHSCPSVCCSHLSPHLLPLPGSLLPILQFSISSARHTFKCWEAFPLSSPRHLQLPQPLPPLMVFTPPYAYVHLHIQSCSHCLPGSGLGAG